MKFLQKSFIGVLFCIAFSQFAMAAGYKSVSINLVDGSNVLVNLSDQLVTKFDAEDMILSDGDKVNMKISRAQIKSFSHSEYADIVGVSDDGKNNGFDVATMSFTKLVAGAEIKVYSVDGRVLSVGYADSEGRYSLPITSLPSGIIIISVNKSNTLKINLR